MLFIGNNWVTKRDYKVPSTHEKMYGIKCSNCGGMTIVSENTCKCLGENDRQLQNKQLVYEFATWLQGQNFTNPDISVHDWVETFFQRKCR